MVVDAGDVVLRPFQEHDRRSLVTILSDSELMRLVLDERAFSAVDAETFIAKHFESGDHLGYATVCLKSSGEVIGFSGFRACRYLDELDVEFGWVLARAHHGRGYATALGQRLITRGLESLRLKRVLAACNPLNHASEHILRDKLRMRFERQVEPRPGFQRRVYSAQHASTPERA